MRADLNLSPDLPGHLRPRTAPPDVRGLVNRAKTTDRLPAVLLDLKGWRGVPQDSVLRSITPPRRQVLDPRQARQFLEPIFSPYFKEAARPLYIEVRGKEEADKGMPFRRFYLGIEPLLKDMTTWPADQHYWFGIAPRWSDRQGEKKHCLALTVLFQDVDYGKVGHKKNNKWQTREEAQAAIDAFPIPPSIVVHTGGGFQTYWILKEPFAFENSNYAQVEAILKGIGATIGGDSGTQDISRIFRLPGTYNVKTDVPRPVELVECHPDMVYDLADFAHFADQTPPEQGQDQPRQEAPQDGPQTTNVDELNVPAWVKGLIRSGDASGYGNDRSARDHAVINALKRAGRNLDTIETIFRDNPIGDRYREEEQKRRGGRKYLQLSFDKAQAPPIGPAGFTDVELFNFAKAEQVGDARLFIRLFKDKFVYDHADGRWYRWGGHYWQDDVVDTVLMALDRVVDLYQLAAGRCAWRRAQATREGDNDTANEAKAWETLFTKKIKNLQNIRWRCDVLEFSAAGEESLGIAGREWDQSTMTIACLNGIVDLHTGGFRPGKPGDYIKAACPTEWKGLSEPAPAWEKFILQVFDGDTEMVNYLQRLLGYALAGDPVENIMSIPWGPGFNGKSTIFETLKHILGDDLAGPVPSALLLEDSKNKNADAPTPSFMALRGKRLVWASETNEGRKLNAGQVKYLTGGDSIKARDLFVKEKNSVTFRPTHTLFLLTNHLPRVDAEDFAIWERIKPIPFTLSFVKTPMEPHERQRDKHIAKKLKKEASGILAWIVRGFTMWKEQGLKTPDKVKTATTEYRKGEDFISKFIFDRCNIKEGAQVKADVIYQDYISWCNYMGFTYQGGVVFWNKLGKKFVKSKKKDGSYYLGIELIETT